MLPSRNYFEYTQIKSKRVGKDVGWMTHTNIHKKVGANISMLGKADFRARNVKKAVHQEDTVILYVHIRESQNTW